MGGKSEREKNSQGSFGVETERERKEWIKGKGKVRASVRIRRPPGRDRGRKGQEGCEAERELGRDGRRQRERGEQECEGKARQESLSLPARGPLVTTSGEVRGAQRRPILRVATAARRRPSRGRTPQGARPPQRAGGTLLCPAAADGRGSGELTSAEISGHLGGERGQERQCQEGRQATVDLRGTWTATRAGATPWLRKERPRPGRRPEEAFARGNVGATCVLEHKGSGARCVVLHGWTCRDGLGLAGRAGTAAGFPH